MAAGYAVSTKFIGIDRMSGTFKKIARSGTATTSKLQRGFSKVGGALRRLNSSAGKLLSFAGAAGGVYLFQRALRDTITTGLSFEQTMVNASIRFGESVKPGTKAFIELEKKAKQIGISTEHTATQAAEAFRLLGGAGFTAGQAIATSSGLTDLATAAQIDLAQATDAAANSLSVFGLMTEKSSQLEKNMTRTTDVMLAAVNSAKFEVEDYLETMKFAGPIFQASGRSMEEFASMAAILAKAGIKGSLAGTTLKNAMLNLQAPTKQQAVFLKKMNVVIDDGTGRIKSMSEIVKDIAKGTKTWTKIQKAQALSAVFGKRAVAGMMAAVQIGAPAIQEMTDKLSNVTGTTKTFAATVRDTTENRLKLMKSAIESLELSIFEGLKPVITDVTEGIKDWSSRLSEYIEKNPNAVKQITATAAAAVKLIAGLWALSAVLGVINLIMATNPIVLIVMAIIGALVLMIKYWKEVKIYVQTALIGMAVGAALVGVAMGGILLPIFAIVAAIYLVYDNWKVISEYWIATATVVWDKLKMFGSWIATAFKAYFLTIGEVIVKSMLIPILGVLEVINKIAKFAGFKGIDVAIDKIDSIVRVVSEEAEGSRAEAANLFNPEISQAQQQQETRAYMESVQRRENTLTIKDQTGRASMEKEDPYFKLEPTMTPAR